MVCLGGLDIKMFNLYLKIYKIDINALTLWRKCGYSGFHIHLCIKECVPHTYFYVLRIY